MEDDLSICICALHRCTGATDVFVFPVFDDDNSPPPTPPASASASAYAHRHRQEDTELTPILTCYISPRYSCAFSMIGSELYVMGSHVFPHSNPLDPRREKPFSLFGSIPDFGSECCQDFTSYEDILVLRSLNQGRCCPDRGHHVFHCNIKQPALGWEKGPAFFGSRISRPHPIVVDEKLYVIGGNNNPSHPDIEVLDPTSQQWGWIILTPLPIHWREDTGGIFYMSAVVDNPKRIIVITPWAKYLYIYNVSKNDWNTMPLPSCSRFSFRIGRAAVKGHTLYWFDYRSFKLVALDLDEGKWLRGRVNGLDTEEHFDSTCDAPILIHLYADKFILLWTVKMYSNCVPVITPRNIDSDSDDPDYDKVVTHSGFESSDNHENQTRIHCAKIRISKIPQVKGKYGLKSFIESCHCYVVDHDVTLLDAFLI